MSASPFSQPALANPIAVKARIEFSRARAQNSPSQLRRAFGYSPTKVQLQELRITRSARLVPRSNEPRCASRRVRHLLLSEIGFGNAALIRLVRLALLPEPLSQGYVAILTSAHDRAARRESYDLVLMVTPSVCEAAVSVRNVDDEEPRAAGVQRSPDRTISPIVAGAVLGEASATVRGQGVCTLVSTVAMTMVFFGALTILAVYYTQGNDPMVPRTGNRTSAVIVVQNKVVISADGLVEDRSLAYLSRRPIARCAEQRCEIEGTKVETGVRMVAVCFTFGEGMTNMDLASSSARRNPDRVSSNLWYGVRAGDQSLGFVSEVYLTQESRGGLSLRRCSDLP